MRALLVDDIKYIKQNKLKEVSSVAVDHSAPDTLFSVDIFGDTPEERNENMAYIDLKGHYVTPLVFVRIFKRHLKIVADCIEDKTKCKIDNGGILVRDETGSSGMNWFYKNFDKINWKKSM